MCTMTQNYHMMPDETMEKFTDPLLNRRSRDPSTDLRLEYMTSPPE